jgi:hypothetical protein
MTGFLTYFETHAWLFNKDVCILQAYLKGASNALFQESYLREKFLLLVVFPIYIPNLYQG